MNTQQPSALAVWLLRRLYPERNREVITGDLLERFRQGRSALWFWRQVLMAILVGGSGRLKPHWTEVCIAAAGTLLIACPWEVILPLNVFDLIFPVRAFVNWGARLPWPLDAPFLAFSLPSAAGAIYTISVIEIASALMVLPLFAIFSFLWRRSCWANLRRVFLVCTVLFAVGDLPAIWSNVTHPAHQNFHLAINQSEAIWAIALQDVWIFATLVISARLARRVPSAS
jgi:hypothetical protein